MGMARGEFHLISLPLIPWADLGDGRVQSKLGPILLFARETHVAFSNK